MLNQMLRIEKIIKKYIPFQTIQQQIVCKKIILNSLRIVLKYISWSFFMEYPSNINVQKRKVLMYLHSCLTYII